jgi:hypothetical protein
MCELNRDRQMWTWFVLVPSPTLILGNPIHQLLVASHWPAIQHSVDLTANTHDVESRQGQSCHCWEHVCRTAGHTAHNQTTPKDVNQFDPSLPYEYIKTKHTHTHTHTHTHATPNHPVPIALQESCRTPCSHCPSLNTTAALFGGPAGGIDPETSGAKHSSPSHPLLVNVCVTALYYCERKPPAYQGCTCVYTGVIPCSCHGAHVCVC